MELTQLKAAVQHSMSQFVDQNNPSDFFRKITIQCNDLLPEPGQEETLA